MILRFGRCELDLARVVLSRDGEEVRLEPQAYDVLAYLAERRGTVVRKEELLDGVWGDRFVSESALTTRIKSVRQAVGDDGTRQAVIRTVHGRGYEFIAAVEIVDRPTESERAATDDRADALPAAVQMLIGRDELLGQLVGAVGAHRLNTLVGPGGVGKTALSLEVARHVAPDFPDGVHIVELVTVVDASATAEAVATALDVNIRRQSSIVDSIIELLRSQRCLLLLDNCEHLIEPVADLVARILREAPAVSLLATCREPLAVAGEYVRLVEPLPTTGGTADGPSDPTTIPAVALFVERARAIDPAFVLDATTAPVVEEICRRLDGLPLAIELAAARTRAIDVTEIADRLSERFVLLKAMRRGSDLRHRTMHGAISWSYELLEPEEQQLFTALSVFAGPFDLRSAEAVGGQGDALDLVTRLTERSMLSVRRMSDGSTRYELLETLREYGRAQLTDDRAARLFAVHAEHFRSEAAGIELGLRTEREPQAMANADGSFADLRAAQRFALDVGDLDTAFTLIGSTREFAMRAMRYEVFAWAEVASRAPGAADHPGLPLLTGIRAYGAWVRGEFDLAIELAHETRALEAGFGVVPSGLAERTFGNVLYIVNQFEQGHEESMRQVELARDSGEPSRFVHACYMASVAMSATERFDEAEAFIEQARPVALTTGSPTDLASVAVSEGFASHGEVDTALAAFGTAQEFASAAGNRWMHAFATTEVSGLLVHRGELQRGCAGLAEMIGVWSRAGDWSHQWITMARCVIALHRMGRDEMAAELVGAIEARATLGAAPVTSTLRNDVFETRAALAAALGDDRVAELRVRGASTPVEKIVGRTRDVLRVAAAGDAA